MTDMNAVQTENGEPSLAASKAAAPAVSGGGGLGSLVRAGYRGLVRTGRLRPKTMSLNLRLTLTIGAALALSMLVGALMLLNNDRRAVDYEARSATDLVVYLLNGTTNGLHFKAESEVASLDYLAHQLATLRTRHVHIALVDPSGQVVGGGTALSPPIPNRRVPAWFVRLMHPQPIVHRLPIFVGARRYGYVVVSAYPGDEIAEKWRNLVSILRVAGLAFVLISAVILWSARRTLRVIDKIVAGLERLKQGDFSIRLPAVGAGELAQIVEKFNRVASTLDSAMDENRRLAQRVINLQEAERRSIARELHDELGQCLFAIQAEASCIERFLSDGRYAEIGQRTRSIADIAQHVHGLARRAINRLRPLALDELKLHDALRSLVMTWSSQHPETHCSLHLDEPLGDLGEGVDIAVYRLVQESLTNVAQHANASEVTITLRDESGPDRSGAGAASRTLILEVKDNGRGIGAGGKTGTGLVGMRERVRALGGTISIESTSGAGTCVVAQIPLDGHRADGTAS